MDIAARDAIVKQILDEVDRATQLFPKWSVDVMHAVCPLNEEVGELNRAINQVVYEPWKASTTDVREEAIQTGAMVIRFLLHMDEYTYKRSEEIE